MATTFTSLKTVGALTVGSVLTVVGALVGASFSGPAGSDTVITSPSGQDIVYQLAGTEVSRLTTIACTATGGLAAYDVCYMPSPLTTTGSIHSISVQCGSVALALPSDVSFVKAAHAGTGTSLRQLDNITLGTGAYFGFGTGNILWNPADKIKLATATTPTGTLSTARYDCVMRVTVEDIYGR
jgi:hypothetical protein